MSRKCIVQHYLWLIARLDVKLWAPFAKLVLEATYEATLHAALLNYENTGNKKVYLTLVGGGAFGNPMEWIWYALRNAILKFSSTPLDIMIVSYGSSNAEVRAFVDSFTE